MKARKKKSPKPEPIPQDLKPAADSRGGVYQVQGAMMSNIQVSRPPFSNYKFGSLL